MRRSSYVMFQIPPPPPLPPSEESDTIPEPIVIESSFDYLNEYDTSSNLSERSKIFHFFDIAPPDGRQQRPYVTVLLPMIWLILYSYSCIHYSRNCAI